MRDIARSLLFVPGHRPDRFTKALESGADAVVIDLEDAVPPAMKETAREQVARWLGEQSIHSSQTALVLRINGEATPWHRGDVALCAQAGVRSVMLPKSEDADGLAELAQACPRAALLPLVESARGIANLNAIAGASNVQRLVFGSIDFQADLDIEGEGEELLFFRSAMVLASRLAGLAAPIDGVSTSIDDMAATVADATRARRLGFGGKLCIHPRQVNAVNASFSPTPAQLEWAQRVIAADAASAGAPVAVDGKMVDRPVVLKAQALMRAARG